MKMRWSIHVWLLALAAQVLRYQGYRVLEAANGEEALHIAREHAAEPIVLLVSDMVTPRLGDIALAEQLAGLRPEIRVLFMSGYTDAATIKQRQVASRAEFLQKPFLPGILARKVRELLDS